MQFEAANENGAKLRKTERKFKRAVGRVLIALSFKTSSRTGTGTASGDVTSAIGLSGDRGRSGYRTSSFSGGFRGRLGGAGDMEENGKMVEVGSFDWKTMTDCDFNKFSSSLHRTRGVSEDSDQEPTPPPKSRRERRKAICESKVLGLSNTQDDDSCDGSETSVSTGADNVGQRQRSMEDLSGKEEGAGGGGGGGAGDGGGGVDTLMEGRPRRRVVPPPLVKRNTIADFANTKAYQVSMANFISTSDQDKRTKSTFSLLKLIDKKSHHSRDNLCQLSDVLQTMRPSEFDDSQLAQYKDVNWVKLFPNSEADVTFVISETERKRREAVWELFTSECVFLFDHLMALKHCFMEPLKKVQVEGHLMFAEPQDLFGNLDELCYVSYTFCYDFIRILLKDIDVKRFGKSEVLVKGLKQLCELTRDGEVYHDYCLNYPKAISYLEQLRKNEDFCEFEKWCEQDPRCHRLQLTDLLISPLQHWTKVPLLLNSIQRYTIDPDEQHLLTDSLGKLDTSLKMLEVKMKTLRNYERLQELQQQIVWLPITELEPRTFIPEFLKPTLARQPCAKMLTSPKRQLIHEGPVTLIEISKTVDMYMFLFDDILLLTKVKKPPRKKTSIIETSPQFVNQKLQTDGAMFVVHRQPLALDRFAVHDIKPLDAIASGLKNAFVLLQVSRFQQILGVFTLQTCTEVSKVTWISQLQTAQEKFRESLKRLDALSSRGSSNDNLIFDDNNFADSFFNCQTTNIFRNHLNIPTNRSASLHPLSTPLSNPIVHRNLSCPDTAVTCPQLAIHRAYNGRSSSPTNSSTTDLYLDSITVHPVDFTDHHEGSSVLTDRGWTSSNVSVASSSRQYLSPPSILDEDYTEGQGSQVKVIPRSRPSSLHSKRRSMLKVIREKSLSIDLTTVPN